MVAALVIPWRQVLALVVQATIVNNRLINIIVLNNKRSYAFLFILFKRYHTHITMFFLRFASNACINQVMRVLDGQSLEIRMPGYSASQQSQHCIRPQASNNPITQSLCAQVKCLYANTISAKPLSDFPVFCCWKRTTSESCYTSPNIRRTR